MPDETTNITTESTMSVSSSQNTPGVPNLPNLPGTQNKPNYIKLIIIIVAIVLVVSGLAIGTFYLLKNNVAKKETDKSKTTKSTVEIKKDQAVEAENDNDNAKALELYKQLKDEYEAAGDSQGVVDMDAKIFLLEQKQ